MFFKKNKKINTVIASPDISRDSIRYLNNMNINVIFSCENNNVLRSLRYHADMQISFVEPGKAVCAPECYQYYKSALMNCDCEIMAGDTILSCNYPGDIAYNIIVAEKTAIHNFRYTDPKILNFISSKKCVNVSQGYTACTLCMINENAFITSDRGIKRTLVGLGADVLLIDDSQIRLKGFEHGFFGGASVMLSENILAVNGNVMNLSDGCAVCNFCAGYGVDVISLSDEYVTDVGSIIPVV